MTIFIVILAALMMTPGAAQAEPISSAFAVAFAAGSAGGLIAGVSAFAQAIGATFVGKLIFGAALSLVGQLFTKKPKGTKPSGIQTEQTTVGDTTPQKFIVGRYAVEGHAIVPAYSYGPDNSVLTYVLEVSNIPVNGLTGRAIIDGQYTDLVPADDDATRLNFDTLGYQPTATTLGSFSTSARGWLWFYDGTQTTASAHMVEVYGSHPDRPWTVNHILKKSAYAVLEFPLNRNVYSGMPAVRFEVDGISLYDPRKDTTVGGSGAHRWADPATWEFTRNPQVISYNVLRGITLPSGDIYGGEVPAEDLPLDNWFAAMNECDVVIGDRPQYVAGFEINTGTMEPFEVIEEMNRASFAQMSEFGGVFRVRVGAPAAPVMSLTDDDFMITEPSRYDPFPGLADTYNAVTGTYVEPADIWEGRSADAVLNAGWEAEDGGRRLTINIGLPAVSDKSQAQHLLNSYLKDQRRFRVHQMVLPPSFAEIEMLDTISWTSEINGYTAKTFEVMSVEDRPDTLNQMVTVREREAGDVAWEPADDLPAVVPHNPRTEPAQIVPTLTISAFGVPDGDGVPRKNGIRIAWPAGEAPSAELLKYEIRLADDDDEVVTTGTVGTREGKTVTSDGLVPVTDYEVRAKYLTGMPSEWSDWESVTTLSISSDGLVLDLTASAFTVPANADGSSPDLTGVASTATVLNGNVDDTSKWTISRTNSTSISSTLTGSTVTVTGMAIDRGYIDVSATRPGYPTLTKRVTLAKAKEGAPGADGDDGAPGADGARGPGRWHVAVASLPSTGTAANSAFVGSVGAPVANDQAWFYTGTQANPTGQGVWIYNGSSWDQQNEVIDGNLLVTKTITSAALLLTGTNLLDNGDFSTGDLTGWRPYTNSGDIAVVSVSGSPSSKFALRHYTTSAKTVTTFSGNKAYSDEGALNHAMPLKAGKSYRVSLDAIQEGGTATLTRIIVFFHKKDGSYNTSLTAITLNLTSSWERYSGTFVAPTDVIGGHLYIYSTDLDGTQFFTSIEVKEMDGADLIVDGGIKAGMGIFSGPLESDDFDAGVAGWQITKAGDAEFNSLVTRSWVVDGAVSNKGSDAYAGPAHRVSTTVLNTYLGPVQTDQFWQVAFYGEARIAKRQWEFNGVDSWLEYNYPTNVYLDVRYLVGGSWSTWANMDVYTTNNDLVYDVIKFSETIQGDYEDVQLRVQTFFGSRGTINQTAASQGTDTLYNNVRNFTLVARALVR